MVATELVGDRNHPDGRVDGLRREFARLRGEFGQGQEVLVTIRAALGGIESRLATPEAR